MRFVLMLSLVLLGCSGDTGDTGDTGNTGDTANTGDTGRGVLVCVECAQQADCVGTPGREHCNTQLHACVACLIDDDCTGFDDPDCIDATFCAKRCAEDLDCAALTNGRDQCFENLCWFCNEDDDCIGDPVGPTCLGGVCGDAVDPFVCTVNADCAGRYDTCNLATGVCECNDDLDCDGYGGVCTDGECTCTSDGDCTLPGFDGACLEP